jgi:hypothetical protein
LWNGHEGVERDVLGPRWVEHGHSRARASERDVEHADDLVAARAAAVPAVVGAGAREVGKDVDRVGLAALDRVDRPDGQARALAQRGGAVSPQHFERVGELRALVGAQHACPPVDVAAQRGMVDAVGCDAEQVADGVEAGLAVGLGFAELVGATLGLDQRLGAAGERVARGERLGPQAQVIPRPRAGRVAPGALGWAQEREQPVGGAQRVPRARLGPVRVVERDAAVAQDGEQRREHVAAAGQQHARRVAGQVIFERGEQLLGMA